MSKLAYSFLLKNIDLKNTTTVICIMASTKFCKVNYWTNHNTKAEDLRFNLCATEQTGGWKLSIKILICEHEDSTLFVHSHTTSN